MYVCKHVCVCVCVCVSAVSPSMLTTVSGRFLEGQRMYRFTTA